MCSNHEGDSADFSAANIIYCFHKYLKATYATCIQYADPLVRVSISIFYFGINEHTFSFTRRPSSFSLGVLQE